MRDGEWLQSKFSGFFQINFVGDPEPRRVRIYEAVLSSDDHILFLQGENGTIYNWNAITSMTKIKES